MQRRSQIDWLLCGSVGLLAFSILGLAYRLWQNYSMAAR
jgi:hypothetical protein